MAYLINPLGKDEMRRLAQRRLMRRGLGADTPGLPPEAMRHLEELTLSHLELELQNEHHEHSRIQLDQAVNQFRELYDFAPVPLLCLSAQGHITRLNFAAARSLGQDRVRLLGQKFALFLDVADAPRLDELFQAAMAEPDVHRRDVTLCVTGIGPCHWSIQVNGKGDGSISMALIDITPYRLAEQAQLRQANSWRQVVEAVGVGTWDWHIPSGQVSHSSYFGELLEFKGDQHELTLELWRERVHPEDWPGLLACLQSHLQAQSPSVVMSYRISQSTGEWRRVTLRGAVTERELDGSPVRMMGTLVAAL